LAEAPGLGLAEEYKWPLAARYSLENEGHTPAAEEERKPFVKR
jgi:hypothetical protein